MFNWDTLIEYYSQVSNPTPRQVKLKKVFVDKEFETLLKLVFVQASTRDVMEAIAYFEQRENKIHLARKKMEDILKAQLVKFVKRSKIETIDDEGNVTKKSGNDLLLIDVNKEENFVSKNLVFVGEKCENLIRGIGLSPSSPQLEEFYETVFKFYSILVSKLQGYFSIGLRSIELKYMESFSPYNQRNVNTADQMLYLGGSFTKILKNIRPHDGFDKLRSEVEMYRTDPDVERINKNLSYNDYWLKVGEIKEGGWEVYETLPRFALVCGTPFNSSAEMERGFSVQSDILRDPKRNRMSHETLDTHMQIKYGMESKETRAKCDKCNDTSTQTCPCHCKFADISDKMRLNCSHAWRAMNTSKETASVEARNEEILSEGGFTISFQRRLDKFKESIDKRPTLGKEKQLKRKQTSQPQAAALENRKQRIASNNNTSNKSPRSKRAKNIPLRFARDKDSDTMNDITEAQD